MAAPPAVAWSAPAAAAWLQYLVPLLGGAGSLAFLFAVPGPRHPLLVAAVAGTAVASLALGVGLRLIERRTARRARRRERSRYLAHLAQMAAAADHLAAAQLAAADHLHPDPPRLWALVCRAERLWERRPADDDFLTVRVGRGPVPLHTPVRLDTAGGPLVERDAELLAAAETLARRAGCLPQAPVTVPLRRLGVLALTGPRDRIRALARALLCQLAALHAPEDLRILAAFPPAALPAWEWLKWLPHTRDPAAGTGGMPGCLLAETPAQLAALLDREVRPRLTAPAAGPPLPHLLAVLELDPPRRGAHGPLLDELLDRAAGAGATVIWLARDPASEPSELAARLLLDEHGTAAFQETAPGGRRIDAIRADDAGVAVCEAVARKLAPLRLDRQPAAVPAGPVRPARPARRRRPPGPAHARGHPPRGARGHPPGGARGHPPRGARGHLAHAPPSPGGDPAPARTAAGPAGVRPGGAPLLLDPKEGRGRHRPLPDL